ncbi:hypothetical protein KCV01_g24973, partial [Aureobasidium melanogenum]
SRANAGVLRDTHWVGGDPGRLDVYGWASWTPAKAILTLRNPSDKAQLAVIDLDRQLELPPGAKRAFQARSPWKADAGKPELALDADKPQTITLEPFQSTTGSIAGSVAPESGDSVHIESDTGFQRDVPIDARGRYAIPQLPLGTYTVTLRKGGAAVQSRANVSLRVGVATDVSFQGAGPAQNLEGVSVSANAIPPIDVTSVDSRTVITAQQMARLPLGFSAESVARLAPGVVGNAGGFTSETGNSLISFGGSAANENAYYINGFNTTDPLQSAGGLTLPYGSIEQEQVYTGGYSAQYG